MKNRSRKFYAQAVSLPPAGNRPLALILVTFSAVLLLALWSAKTFGQTPANGQTPTTPPPAHQQGSSSKEYLGPSGDSIRPYRPAGRDPFRKVLPQRIKPNATGGTKTAPKPLGFPSLEERRAKYRTMVEDYSDKGLAEPNPVAQYLVSELEITGVFRDETGYGAFARAIPTGTTFFIRRGTRCFNGEVLRIESDTSDSGAKVTFRQESFVDINGKQVKQENVVSKQPTASPSRAG
ncbi:MAG: hypothetical protein HY231_09000 [Acidobacteria bacterium]|nr:hypothetical protein [Acidobacteriota bacterium]